MRERCSCLLERRIFRNRLLQCRSYMIAWGPSQASQRASARALLGLNSITGRLPISIPPFARFGDGEQRGAMRGDATSKMR